jgi:hypothetical protein
MRNFPAWKPSSQTSFSPTPALGVRRGTSPFGFGGGSFYRGFML